MEQETTKKVQLCEIDILEKIDAICTRHGLEYFAIGGTVLGAVRHGGFIPWDDDIDVGMPRADYEKFLAAAAAELPDGYHIQNIFTEPATPFYFTKIRRDGTRFVEYYLKDLPIHHGVFVDVFPFDNIPDKPWLAKLHFRLSRFLYQLYLCKTLDTVFSSRFEQLGQYKKTGRYYVRKIVHFLLTPVPKGWLFAAVDKASRLFNGRETRRLGHIVRRRLAVDRTVLYPIRRMPFDTTTMPVPNDPDAYLRGQFGDYWQLPPEDKRYGHLPYLVEVEMEHGGT